MKIKIGRKTYTANTSMIALLRYWNEFGESYLKAFFEPQYSQNAPLLLVRLVWASIEEKKPDFIQFLTAASKCKNFDAAARSVQAGILKTAGFPQSGGKSSGDSVEETDILALMAISGLSMDLIYELPAFYILSIINKKTDILGGSKNGKSTPKFRKMSDTEVREAYRR